MSTEASGRQTDSTRHHTGCTRGNHAATERAHNTDTTRSPPARVNDYRHRYTGTGVDDRTTGTGRHRKDEDGAARERDPYHHATRRGNDNDERARRRQTGTTETNGEGTASAAILGRRRDAAGTGLDDAEPRAETRTGLQRLA